MQDPRIQLTREEKVVILHWHGIGCHLEETEESVNEIFESLTKLIDPSNLETYET